MEQNASRVPHIGVTVKQTDVYSDSLKVLKVIRPQWKPEAIKFKLLTDGITNNLVACLPELYEEDDTVLIRIYGNKTDLLIDRQAENRNILLLNKYGLAPSLYATFVNGLAYQFVPGCTLNTENVRRPEIYHLVATNMAKLHKVKVDGVEHPKANIWKKARKFLDTVPDAFSKEETRKRFLELPSKSRINQELELLRRELDRFNNDVVFCHNDLLLGNIIWNESSNHVTFIDYEYAGFNYQAFDIANHFAEFAGVDEVDYSRYPSKTLQMDWLSTYLVEFTGNIPTKAELDSLYVIVNKFVLLTHLFWGIWGLIQAEHSYIDFDFIKYAKTRFDEYFSRKEHLIAT
ncbi:ethanolamine kinase 2 [Cylas formicarius]|uniref:ethanolamine kinase 2 n=1 Tax=Cylas formicarius TaxID=197179 RepID=UPI002958471F|nr:ethanolamine kinase 2 [Cylas formicarius]XP_060525464.1 ethanolamine kinase 2 [Cylas formicarius]XP_060525465.1 ethanolamine kinase 2 [Cylas formicarius]XP_060525466.1 ethanolamine kinase 2 [Cylas formicarius]